jgi:hypothetical protein
MDEFTQTNGSLVAQAAEASQTMAQRAGDLNAMMERYQLDEARDPRLLSDAALGSAQDATPRAAAAKVAAALAAERRGAARPWSARHSTRPAAARSANTAVAPMSGFTKAGDNDTDWKEF